MIRFKSEAHVYVIAIVLGLIIASTPQFRQFLWRWNSPRLEGRERRYKPEGQAIVIGASPSYGRIVGKFGFVDKTGAQIVAPVLDETTDFSQGFAVVQTAEHWNIMNKSGKMMLKPRIGTIMQVQPCTFVDGLTPMNLDGKWGFVDRMGDWAIKPEFDQVELFDHGFAKVEKQNEGWGYINTTGTKVVPLRFTNLSSFHQGLAAAENENGVGLIGTDGRWRVFPKYKADFYSDQEDGGVFGDGVFVLARANAYATSGDPVTYDFFDTNGKLIATFTCQEMHQFSEGSAAFQNDFKWGFVDKHGTTTIKPRFSAVQPFKYGLGAVKEVDENSDETMEQHWQYVTSAGKTITGIGSRPLGALPIDRPNFSDGLAAIHINNRWGFVNASGRIVVEPRFEEVGDFHDGMAWVMPSGQLVEH